MLDCFNFVSVFLAVEGTCRNLSLINWQVLYTLEHSACIENKFIILLNA